MKIKLERKQKTNKVKKVPTIKVGTHKKTSTTLWILLLTSITFGVYKNFTAIDQHTTHEKKVVEQRLMDTNKIESFSRNFITVFYSWEHNQKSLNQRTEKLKDYLTEELQILNADMVRSDIPTNSIVESIQFWDVKPIEQNNFDVLFSVTQTIIEQNKKQKIDSVYTLTIHLDDKENMVIVKSPTISSIPTKSNYKPKLYDTKGDMDTKTIDEIDSFLQTFFKLYPKANEKELSYYVRNKALKPISKEYKFLDISSNYSKENNQITAQTFVKYFDSTTKTAQLSEFHLTIKKYSNWTIIN